MSLKNSLKVMVVDDMSTSRALITQALDSIGIKNYLTENNGKDALKKLSLTPVHLVLSDFNMPELNGIELLQAIRQNKSLQKLGFILVTGKPTPEMINHGKSLGLNNIIKKPFTSNSMRQCIENVVGKL